MIVYNILPYASVYCVGMIEDVSGFIRVRFRYAPDASRYNWPFKCIVWEHLSLIVGSWLHFLLFSFSSYYHDELWQLADLAPYQLITRFWLLQLSLILFLLYMLFYRMCKVKNYDMLSFPFGHVGFGLGRHNSCDSSMYLWQYPDIKSR